MPQIGMPGWFNRHHDSMSQELDAIKAQNVLILQAMERLIKMSSSLSDQLTAALASISADVDAVSTEVTALLAALSGQVGQPVTQAMVDAANSIDQRLKAIPPAPAAPAP